MESTNESECSFGQEESSDENVNLAVREEASGSPQTPPTFQVLSVEKVVEEMNEFIKEANVVRLPSTNMRILLNHFRWDKDVLLEGYYDGDRKKLFRDAGIISPAITEVGGKGDACKRCLKTASTYGMACGHRFCTNCWEAYLNEKIGDEMDRISCPAPNCAQVVDDMKVTELVGDAQLQLKYQKKITDSFVHYEPLMRWCPSPDCTNAIKVESVERTNDKQGRPVTCTCNHTFCFECGENWHHPIPCQLLKMWNEIVPEEAERLQNSQKCAECQTRIESGRFRRGFLYCWECSRKSDESKRSCVPYDKSPMRSSHPNPHQNFLQLKCIVKPFVKGCFLFYHRLYFDNEQSLKFEKELRASVMGKVKDEFGLVISGNLEKAFGVLRKSRQTLMYTYVFAYFLRAPVSRRPQDKNVNQIQFEANQTNLEIAIEALSGHLQLIIQTNDFSEPGKVQDMRLDCERRCKLIGNHLQEGYDKEWWRYDDDLLPLLLNPLHLDD